MYVQTHSIHLPKWDLPFTNVSQIRRRSGSRVDAQFQLSMDDNLEIDRVVADVHNMAGLWRNLAPESHWIHVVVAPLLNLIRRLSPFSGHGRFSNSNITVLDMYARSIIVFNLPSLI